MGSIELFAELLQTASPDLKDYLKKVPVHESQFSFSELNKICFEKIYLSLKEPVKRQDLFPVIPGLESTCPGCYKHYFKPRNKSVFGLDVQLGKKFQTHFVKFLESKRIDCKGGDEKNKKYPDLAVFDNAGKVKAYLELKYQSSPWLLAYKDTTKKRECYESSPALDVKKLLQQNELVTTGEINAPIFYVFWLDFPCVKGVFFIPLERALMILARDGTFSRKIREGDFDKSKNRKGQTEKVHISIFEMGNFENLLDELKK